MRLEIFTRHCAAHGANVRLQRRRCIENIGLWGCVEWRQYSFAQRADKDNKMKRKVLRYGVHYASRAPGEDATWSKAAETRDSIRQMLVAGLRRNATFPVIIEPMKDLDQPAQRPRKTKRDEGPG